MLSSSGLEAHHHRGKRFHAQPVLQLGVTCCRVIVKSKNILGCLYALLHTAEAIQGNKLHRQILARLLDTLVLEFAGQRNNLTRQKAVATVTTGCLHLPMKPQVWNVTETTPSEASCPGVSLRTAQFLGRQESWCSPTTPAHSQLSAPVAARPCSNRQCREGAAATVPGREH